MSATTLPEDVPSVRLDGNGCIKEVNSKWSSYCGYTEQDAVGEGLDLLHGEGTEKGKIQQLEQACLSREEMSIEMTNYNKDGICFINAMKLRPEGLSELIVTSDIKFVLPEDEPALILDSEFCVVDANDKWLDFCGFLREEVLGHYLQKLLEGPETETERVDEFESMTRNKKKGKFSVTYYTEDKIKFVDHFRSIPVGDGQVVILCKLEVKLQSHVPSAKFDDDGKVLEVNKTWLNHCGFEREEVIGSTMKILQGPATEKDKVEALLGACKERRNARVTITNYTKDNLMVKNQVRLFPLKDGGFITVNIFQHVLREDIPSAKFDNNGRVTDVNDIWLKYCGFSREEVLGNTMKIIQGKDTELDRVATLEKGCRERRRLSIVITNYTKNGMKIRNTITLYPVGDDEFLTLNDLRFLLPEDAPSALFDKSGRVVDVNEQLLSYIGYDRKEVLGETFGKLQGEGTEAARVKDLLDACNEREPICVTITNYAKSGHAMSNTIDMQPVGVDQFITMNTFSFKLRHNVPSSLLNEKGELQNANKQWLQWFGYRLTEVAGVTTEILAGEETEQARSEELKKCLQERKQAQLKITHYTKDGKQVLNALSLQPVGPSEFITEHELTPILVAEAPCCVVDSSGNIAKVNNLWQGRIGVNIANLNALKGPLTDSEKMTQLLKQCEGGQQYDCQLTLYSSNGEAIESRAVVVPVGPYCVLTLEDMTYVDKKRKRSDEVKGACKVLKL